MARTEFITASLLALALGISACAPSPLYVRSNRSGTVGEIPRDGRGEPIWSAIRPAPAVIPPAPQPPSGSIQAYPPAAGIPIIPPHD
jgi:hypothetical protein